jgi:hypothetical protein
VTVDLDRLAALAEKATPGPWEQMLYWPLLIVRAGDERRRLGASSDPREDTEEFAHPIAEVRESTHFEGCESFTRRRFDRKQNAADAAFIAAVREAVPELIQRVRELEAALLNIATQAGEDTSGLDHAGQLAEPPIEVHALRAVRDLQSRYDECLADEAHLGPWVAEA